MARLTPQQVLDLPMDPANNDAQATSIRDYLAQLTLLVWREDESFDGKRPFGNSYWWEEIGAALSAAGLVPEDAEFGDYDQIVQDAIRAMGITPAPAP